MKMGFIDFEDLATADFLHFSMILIQTYLHLTTLDFSSSLSMDD